MSNPNANAIDADKDRADRDAAMKILDSPDHVLWIVYNALHGARGFRVSEAQHMIAKLAPRKEPGTS